MKIRFLKNHGPHKQGSEIEEGAAAATYLIRVGVAEEITIKDYVEKLEIKQPFKEKAENKTGNVPGSKKRKK